MSDYLTSILFAGPRSTSWNGWAFKCCLAEANRLQNPENPGQTVYMVLQRERAVLIQYAGLIDGYPATGTSV